MKNVIIDCRRLRDRETAHEYLAGALELPAYYGRNLDALYDCLTEMGPCRIILEGAEESSLGGGFCAAVLKTVRDAAADNGQLVLVCG